ncbi:hypothetical protein D3C80_2093020 [compost metagenome]
MLAKKHPADAAIQTACVIVDVLREQARSHKRSELISMSNLLAQLLAAKVHEQLRGLGQLIAFEAGVRQAGG